MSGVREMVKLEGCSLQPLGSYLKALGIFRIIAEQVDPEAELFFNGNRFCIRSLLNDENLLSFLEEKYQPTPIMAPWNGGSGFYPKDNLTAINWIRESKGDRLANYREGLQIATQLMASWSDKPKKDDKEMLLQACRASLPDKTVEWLDAAFVLGTESPRYPPLLGTGGNDGRLEFTNNFMQRLTDIMHDDGRPTVPSIDWLRSSLMGDIRPGLLKGQPIGQFDPAGAGGANISSGFEGDSLVNPWDYILMIEGSLFFASGVVKRGEINLRGELSFPFSVRSSGVGYGSASRSDESSARAEIWLPIWSTPSQYPELRALFSEGRSNVERRRSADGVDFARAVATLGVDRGIDSFQRYGFLERNGRAFFAVPLGRHHVRRNPQADLLSGIDDWLSSFRSKASGDQTPASIKRALNGLDRMLLRLCSEESPRTVQSMLIALGACERAMCKSIKWAKDQHLRPVPALPPEWFDKGDDGSAEFRIAAAIALISADLSKTPTFTKQPMRATVEPVDVVRRSSVTRVNWADEGRLLDIGGGPIDLLNGLMKARIKEHLKAGAEGYVDSSPIKASLTDLTAFLDGSLDEGRIIDLFWGCVLLDPFDGYKMTIDRPPLGDYPGAAYSLLKLCHVRPARQSKEFGKDRVPLVPEIHHRASCGNMMASTRMASRRLRGSGLAPKIDEFALSPKQSARVAASLLIPLDEHGVRIISDKILLEMKE